MRYRRRQANILLDRLAKPRQITQVVAGLRQVAKTTLVHNVSQEVSLPTRFPSVDGRPFAYQRRLLGSGGLNQTRLLVDGNSLGFLGPSPEVGHLVTPIA